MVQDPAYKPGDMNVRTVQILFILCLIYNLKCIIYDNDILYNIMFILKIVIASNIEAQQ